MPDTLLKPPLGFLGHRGAFYHSPPENNENSRRALYLAFVLGCGVELDIQLCSDGIIILHDDTLERTAKGDLSQTLSAEAYEDLIRKPVEHLPYATFSSVNIGTRAYPEPVPFYRELFEAREAAAKVTGQRPPIFAELKGSDPRLVSALIAEHALFAQTRAHFLENLHFLAFDGALLRQLKPSLPKGAKCVLNIEEPLQPKHLDEVLYLGLDGVDAPIRLDLNQDLIAAFHRKGLVVMTWVEAKDDRAMDHAAAMNQVISLGIDGCISNLPPDLFPLKTKHL